jgi:hypothetical protein
MGGQLPDIISLHELLKVSFALGHLDEAVLQKFFSSRSLQVSKIHVRHARLSMLVV